MLFKKVTNDIAVIGEKLFKLGLIGSHSGNISTIFNGKIYITRSGSQLGFLTSKDIVSFPITKSKPPSSASVETIVHVSIYRNTNATNIIHVHPPHLITLSLHYDKIIPIDAEGKYYLPMIPVFEAKNPIGSEEVADIAGREMKKFPLIVIKSHGIFVKGKSWDEVLNIASVAEKSATIIFLNDFLESTLQKK